MRGGIFMDHFHVYKDIEARTGGEIYVCLLYTSDAADE